MSRNKLFLLGGAAWLIVIGALGLGRGLIANKRTPTVESSWRRAEVALRSLPLFRRLDSNYCRGAEPAKGGIAALVSLGVKTIVDLRSRYDHTDEVGEAARRMGLGYYRLPLSVWDPPKDDEADEFISLVTDKSKGPFFVFCADGMHRTGEVSAIYRVAVSRWSVELALEEMDEIGFNPYYYSLRNYVWAYARRSRTHAGAAGHRQKPTRHYRLPGPAGGQRHRSIRLPQTVRPPGSPCHWARCA